jgi:hypothetical protein
MVRCLLSQGLEAESMTKSARRVIRFAVVSGALLLPLFSAPAAAQYARQRVLNEPTYQRLRELADELDELATHAAVQAERDQAGRRVRDTKFLRSIRQFARRTGDFRRRVESYQASPWNMDEELGRLLKDARNVQYRIRRARFADEHTREDWGQTVELLNDMIQIYRYGERYEGFRRDRYHRDRTSGSIGVFDSNRYRDAFLKNSPEMRRLARDLVLRSERAAGLVDRFVFGHGGDLRHFAGLAREFSARLDTEPLSVPELQREVIHLIEDAEDAQEEISRRRVPRTLAEEWNVIVRILTQMRNLAGI